MNWDPETILVAALGFGILMLTPAQFVHSTLPLYFGMVAITQGLVFFRLVIVSRQPRAFVTTEIVLSAISVFVWFFKYH
jgi:hypothetical protein